MNKIKEVKIFDDISKFSPTDKEIIELITDKIKLSINRYELLDNCGINNIIVLVLINNEIKTTFNVDGKVFYTFNNYPHNISEKQDLKDSVFRANFQSDLKSVIKYLNENIKKISVIVSYNKSFEELKITNNQSNILNNDKNEEGLSSFVPISPRYKIESIILNEDLIVEVEKTLSILEQRHILYDEWGFGEIESKPKAILNFFGPPGTGKTMMAHGIADKFKTKILALNYADIESKFVGDAPKNLVRAFEMAEKENAVLFFDEADSFLGKRISNVSSSSDQAVNSLRSQMLILLENFTGIIVFATNLITNYDRAFESRIFKHLKFDVPNSKNRKIIITKTIPNKVPFENGLLSEQTIEQLVDISDGFSGREIKNAILDSLASALIDKRKFVKDSDFIDSFEKAKDSRNNLKNEYNYTSSNIGSEKKKDLEKKIIDNLKENDPNFATKKLLKNIVIISLYGALSDGVLKIQEKEALELFCRAFSIEVNITNDKNDLPSLEDSISFLDSKEDKFKALTFLSHVLSSDGNYNDVEKDFLKNFCNKIGIIDISKIDELNTYIDSFANLQNSWDNNKDNIFS
jgi:AAA+ superfamily predicted ATPase